MKENIVQRTEMKCGGVNMQKEYGITDVKMIGSLNTNYKK
jgi:hypothetical protein